MPQQENVLPQNTPELNAPGNTLDTEETMLHIADASYVDKAKAALNDIMTRSQNLQVVEKKLNTGPKNPNLGEMAEATQALLTEVSSLLATTTQNIETLRAEAAKTIDREDRRGILEVIDRMEAERQKLMRRKNELLMPTLDALHSAYKKSYANWRYFKKTLRDPDTQKELLQTYGSESNLLSQQLLQIHNVIIFCEDLLSAYQEIMRDERRRTKLSDIVDEFENIRQQRDDLRTEKENLLHQKLAFEAEEIKHRISRISGQPTPAEKARLELDVTALPEDIPVMEATGTPEPDRMFSEERATPPLDAFDQFTVRELYASTKNDITRLENDLVATNGIARARVYDQLQDALGNAIHFAEELITRVDETLPKTRGRQHDMFIVARNELTAEQRRHKQRLDEIATRYDRRDDEDNDRPDTTKKRNQRRAA